MHPNSRGRAFIGVSITLTLLDTLFVFTRFYTRLYVSRTFGLDDRILFVSWFFSVIVCALFSSEVFLGLGQHDNVVSAGNAEKISKILYANVLFYNISLSSTKMALAIQYLRISTTKSMRISCYILMSVITAYFLMAFLTSAFICTPVRKFWDSTTPGHCINFPILWYFHSTLNIVTDIAIYLLPIRVLASLQLRRDQICWLGGLFALGGLVVLISSLRLYSVHISLISTDKSWGNLPVGVWSDLELRMTLICTSMPALLPFLRRLFPSVVPDDTKRIYSQHQRHIKALDLGASSTWIEVSDLQ